MALDGAPKPVGRPRKRKKVKTLRAELDKWFSRWVRLRDGGVCFTCGRKDEPKRMQCGHFVPRQYLATRYDPENCHCQCYVCNILYGGQPSAYACNLDRYHGVGTALRLESKRREVCHSYPYQEEIEKYKALVLDMGWE